MFTYLFQFFFTLLVVSVVVLAIRTYREDRREEEARINDAYLLAHEFIIYRFENGWYRNAHDEQIQKDFHKKYNELINQ